MPRKLIDKVQITKLSPFRSPKWRYDRIMELLRAEGKRQRCPKKGVDDEYTFRGFAFIRKWEQIAQDVEPEEQDESFAELFPDNPALYYAYEIFLRPDNDMLKGSIEARILARQSDEKIAQSASLGLSSVVDWYEKLFFNVRDRLDSRDYISKQVITPLVGIGLHAVDLNITSKFFGYFCGETFLEFILQGIDVTAPLLQAGQDVSEYMDTFFGNMLRTRAIISATTFEVDKYSVMQLFELHTKLMEAHNEAKASSTPKNQLEETVSALLGVIPWSVGGARQKLLEDTPLGDYIGKAVEPRAQDMLLIAAGESVPQLEALKDKTLPPPRNTEEDKNEDTK